MLNLDKDEKVLLEVRKHWYVLASHTALLLFLALLPGILFSFLSYLLPASLSTVRELEVGPFLYFLWLACIWVYFFIHWTNYYLDVWFITQKRIISIDQIDVFHRKISNLGLDKIQDVTVEQRGMMQTMLKFGDITVKTAADESIGFFLEDANNPDKVREVIFSHHLYEHERAKPVLIAEDKEQTPPKSQRYYEDHTSL